MGSWENTPLWRLEVEWEKYIRATLRERTASRYADVVYDFLKSYPEKTRPEQFLITDVEDWAILRGRKLAPATILRERRILRGFFQWLRQAKGLSLPNPVTVPKELRPAKAKPRLTLPLLQSLSQSAHSQREKTILCLAIAKQTPSQVAAAVGIHRASVGDCWRALWTRSSLLDSYIPLKDFAKAYERLCRLLGEKAVTLWLANLAPESSPSEVTPVSQK